MKVCVEWTSRVAAVALALVVAPSGSAEVKENPYQVIVERNVFNVHPPPPPPPPGSDTPPPPPPKTVVKLTGITTLGGTSKALVEITPEPGKPVEKAILKVGEGTSGVDILAIDVTNATIKVRLANNEFLVGFTNAPSAGGVPNPAMAAARPGMPAIPLPTQPGIVPGAVPTGIPSIIPQPTASVVQPSGGFGNRGGITVSGAEVPNYRAIPSRNVRTDGTAAPNAAPMTRAEAEVHMELLRTIQQQNAGQGRPGPPLPPTTLTPLLQP